MDIKILLNEVARRYKIYEEYNSAEFEVWYKLCEQVNDLEQQLKKKDEVIEKIKITLKEQAIKIPTRIDDMTCEMKYTDEVVKVNQLLRILEDKEVE